jgi:molybdopterin molybdotransferase
MHHIEDNKETLHQKLAGLIQKYDVLLLSGGVSKGKYDLIPEVLDELGVEKLFHRVAQKPGKPFWFGKHEAFQTKVFAFPGNPLATFTGYHYYFRQWLYHSLGNQLLLSHRPLATTLPANPNITLFIPAQLVAETGEVVPLHNNGSGDLFSLARTDGFLLLPRRHSDYKKGEGVQYIDF